MRDESKESYVPAFKLGEVIANFGVGEVVQSANDKFKKGDHLYGSLDFASHQILNKDRADSLVVLENKEKLPWTYWVGVLGSASPSLPTGARARASLTGSRSALAVPGQTAAWALQQVAHVKKGDTVFVTGAMGPVGQVTLGLCHALGARTIASAGSAEKVAFLRDVYKVDCAFNYKTDDVNEVLTQWKKENGPFTVLVDNVAGPQLEAALEHIARGGRIAAVGSIVEYNGSSYGIRNIFQVVAKELKWEGASRSSLFLSLPSLTLPLRRLHHSQPPHARGPQAVLRRGAAARRRRLDPGQGGRHQGARQRASLSLSRRPSRPVADPLLLSPCAQGESFAALFDSENSNFGKVRSRSLPSKPSPS